MVIEEDLLIKFGADIINLAKDDLLFKKNDIPLYYYQIKKGRIKHRNVYADREFVQNFQTTGECVGEFFLFSSVAYPMDAVGMEDCTILRLEQSKFFKLLKANFEIQVHFYQHVADQIYFTYNILDSIKQNNAISCLKIFFDYFKKKHNCFKKYSCKIPYTRKEISALTGLRIETVIRTLKKMEGDSIIKIVDGKILY